MDSRRQGVARWVFYTLCLVGIEQVIKLIIYTQFMEERFCIIEDYMYFTPHFNEAISWYNVKYGLNINLGGTTLLSIIVLGIMLYEAKKHYTEYKKQTVAIMGYATLIAGAIASTIDRIIWGTSLDYIEIKNWIIFDLKDVYISIGILIFMVGYIAFQIKKYRQIEVS